MICTGITKCIKVLPSKSNSKKHGPIKSSDQTVPTQMRACDWSMLFAFASARHTLTNFVILYAYCDVASTM